MATAPATLWEDMVGQVRLNCPGLVRGWFADLRVDEVDAGFVAIIAANASQVAYLEQHCRPAFTDAAQTATGRLVGVSFVPENEDTPGDPLEPHSSQLDTTIALNPHYTFDQLVVGPCNRLAHAAAIAIAENPGGAYNPFFVHGPVGLGKTHLLQAICHAIRSGRPGARCLYLSCETFINHFMDAVEQGALHQFRYRYRHVDVLAIDDIQFLAERERSQEEFFHTFNTLFQSQRQIILSADCSPAELPNLEERLVSRFNSGLVAIVDRPHLETRMAIVRSKAKLRCIEVPEPVIRFISRRINTNTRDLEGALTKIDALSQTCAGKITLKLAEDALGVAQVPPVKIPSIIEKVASRYDLKVAEIVGKKRSHAITFPRHISMYLARKLTPFSLEHIGGYFGGRDHTTVLHASRSIEQAVARDPQLRELVDDLTRTMKNGTL